MIKNNVVFALIVIWNIYAAMLLDMIIFYRFFVMVLLCINFDLIFCRDIYAAMLLDMDTAVGDIVREMSIYEEYI